MRGCGRISRDRQAGTHHMAIAVYIVYATHGGPKLMLACPRRGESRLFSTVRMLPFFGNHRLRDMRRVFQRIISAIHRTRFNGLDLGMDRDHRIAKAVELGFGLALGWL